MNNHTQHYWKTVVETMADGLMIVDARGTILSVNPAMESLTGYRKNDLIGKSCNVLCCDTCHIEQSKGVDHFCALFKDGKIRRARCSLRKKDGTLIYVMKNASVLRDDTGKAVGGVETLSDLSDTIAKETLISDLRKELDERETFYGMIGDSTAMKRIFELIASAARSEAPVIIYGESGTGKELAAHAIHQSGPRKDGPFIKVNCSALNPSLLESELFGHVRGAFTGADRNRVGRFEAAHGGSIFLDEIGEIPPSTQVKLLRVLQEKEIERVGDNTTIPVDVRVISATNKNLREQIRIGDFREDLFYRISVIPLFLPPLRERDDDMIRLINTFVARIRLKTGKPISGMSDAALSQLKAHHWPGNVRELINVIEYAFVLCPEGVITPDHLPHHILSDAEACPRPSEAPRTEPPAPAAEEITKAQLLDALDRARGNKSEAARRLGISRVTLYKKLKQQGIRINKSVHS